MTLPPPDKSTHMDGCAIKPHDGVCLVFSGVDKGGFGRALVVEPGFGPLITGEGQVWDQMTAILRAAPGSTHMERHYRWVHNRTGAISEHLSATQNRDDWTRQACIFGRVWSQWVVVEG